MKETLKVIKREFVDNYGLYHLQNEEGHIYKWETCSDRAFDELQLGATLTASFKLKECSKKEIKNVRFTIVK